MSVITFGETVQVLLEGIPGTNKEAIARAIEKITADGHTPVKQESGWPLK